MAPPPPPDMPSDFIHCGCFFLIDDMITQASVQNVSVKEVLRKFRFREGMSYRYDHYGVNLWMRGSLWLFKDRFVMSALAAGPGVVFSQEHVFMKISLQKGRADMAFSDERFWKIMSFSVSSNKFIVHVDLDQIGDARFSGKQSLEFEVGQEVGSVLLQFVESRKPTSL